MDKQTTARALLTLYREFGVDEALSDQPANWFERSAKPSQQSLSNARCQQSIKHLRSDHHPQNNETPGTRVANKKAPNAAVSTAREIASSCNTLEELEKAVQVFNGCGLKKTAKNTCFARGNGDAKLMLIGEAPGRDEDIQGKPFVGRAGQLLDKMLAAIDLTEDEVYITNIVYWRPPGNRTPTPQEAQICIPFLERQIQLVNPKVIAFLGGAAAKQMLNVSDGIMRLRGKWRDYDLQDHHYDAIATLHPAYLLRNPGAKRLAWRDLLSISDRLRETA